MFLVVVLIMLVHIGAMVASFTTPKDRRVSLWFYWPSLVIAWLSYIAYETIYIPRYCPGECNIRVDLLLIYPYLLLVTISALVYFARRSPSK